MGRQNKPKKQADSNERNRFDAWYKNYESQCWYKNTFLVNEPKEIAKTKGEDGKWEWNNIDDSGCNFTCLAMIIGVNPAYLASKLRGLKLGKLNFFEEEAGSQAITLAGEKGRLVWDQNKPDKKGQILKISDVFLAPHSIVDIIVAFERRRYIDDIDQANDLIKKVHSQGKHIICGYSDHSRLVAGTKNGEYFLYDPNSERLSLIGNLCGEYTLKQFYEEYEEDEEYQDEKAEYCIYSVVKKTSKL